MPSLLILLIIHPGKPGEMLHFLKFEEQNNGLLFAFYSYIPLHNFIFLLPEVVPLLHPFFEGLPILINFVLIPLDGLFLILQIHFQFAQVMDFLDLVEFRRNPYVLMLEI